MAPSFGTSGLRGLVRELTAPLVADYTRAFLHACNIRGTLYLGQDLRASSPAIARAVGAAARDLGRTVVDCGALPTPALALAASSAGAGAVMVTGSHIPDDRNGLKFYTPAGEITKADEAAILAAMAENGGWGQQAAFLDPASAAPASHRFAAAYIQRYAAVFGPQALAGLRLGIYQHSSVARDILVELAQALGADAVPLGRADRFVPVDTEAVDDQTREQLANWAQRHGLDAIWSTDGDGDRPLLADDAGQVIAGDVLGAVTARALGARILCIPVNCNAMIDDMAGFDRVMRCKIGSPYVIAAVETARRGQAAAPVVGFEANGGFLLGFAAGATQGSETTLPRNAPLPALLTRDAALPLIVPLAAARAAGQSLSQFLAALPPRATAADRLQNIPPTASAALLAQLMDPATRAAFLAHLGGAPGDEDLTDGLRLRLADGRIVHLRASGNAPELRIYTEGTTASEAQALLARALSQTRAALAPLVAQDTSQPEAAQIKLRKGQS